MLDAPLLVLVDLETTGAAPADPGLKLLTAARELTGGDVVTLALQPLGRATSAALAGAGTTRLLSADLGEAAHLPTTTAGTVVTAVDAVQPVAVLIVSDYRSKELVGQVAVVLGSACVSDVTTLRTVDTELYASRLVLSGSWSIIAGVASGDSAPIVTVCLGITEAATAGGVSLTAEPLEVPVNAEVATVRLVSREAISVASDPALSEACTVAVGGRGVDGDSGPVCSLAQPLDAVVGTTRVARSEGWTERSAQIGQTGETTSPRLYISLGASGTVHHTSGIRRANTVVAICDDSGAPIFEMADFDVIGDVTEVVPQLVEGLTRLRD